MFKAIRSPAIAVVVSTAMLRSGAPKPRGPCSPLRPFSEQEENSFAGGLSE